MQRLPGDDLYSEELLYSAFEISSLNFRLKSMRSAENLAVGIKERRVLQDNG